MNIQDKIIKEFEEKFLTNPNKTYCFATGDEKREMVSFLLQSCKQVAEDMLKEIMVEKRGTANYTNSHEAIMNSDRDYGYSQAIDEIQQKGQQFIQENFK